MTPLTTREPGGPTVLETYLAGTILAGLGNGTRAAATTVATALSGEEKALVRLLVQ